MKAAQFDYVAVDCVDDAVDALSSHPGSQVLAGGQSLVPMMAARAARPSVLVDINRVTELAGVRADGDKVVVGAMVRIADLTEALHETLPVCADVVRHIATPAVRHRGTVGGSVAFAQPGAELPVLLAALDTLVHLRSSEGSRTLAIRDFVMGPFQTAKEQGELVCALEFAIRPPEGMAFAEVARRHAGVALGSAVATAVVDEHGKVETATLTVGGANPVPLRVLWVEQELPGSALTAAVEREIARAVETAVCPWTDAHADASYRRVAVGVAAGRAMRSAVERAVRIRE